jgi:hypothetical protein
MTSELPELFQVAPVESATNPPKVLVPVAEVIDRLPLAPPPIDVKPVTEKFAPPIENADASPIEIFPFTAIVPVEPVNDPPPESAIPPLNVWVAVEAKYDPLLIVAKPVTV